MKLFIAKTAGFCMGVRRAVEIALDASNTSESPICSYGPLIHNPQVLSLLKEKGVEIINEVPFSGNGTALIRAHGVPPNTIRELEKAGYKVIDATCPRVIKVQTIIARHAAQENAVIIIGDHEHPEVTGLLGYTGNKKGYVVDSLEALKALPIFDKAIIVAQTTQNTKFFNAVKAWTLKHAPHYKIFDTICDSTEKRQAEVNRLAESVDAMIVVGGFNSGNTRRLAQVAREAGKQSFHIEDETELDISILAKAKSVGITAGASTPNWVISNVYRRLETLPYEKSKYGFRLIPYIERTLLMTNIYVAAGAGCLTYACSMFQEIDKIFSYIMIAFLYVLSMHTLNNLTGGKADHYNNPERALYYEKNRSLLGVMAVSAGGAGLLTAYTKGLIPFLVLFAMSVTGVMYNLKLIPDRFMSFPYRRIKDIPGSKTVLIVIAWGIVTSLFPVMAAKGGIEPSTLPILLWVMGIVFVRTAFIDILDMQGDRIVGKETIPIFLGEKKTRKLLKNMLIFLFALPIVFVLSGFIPLFGIILFLVPVLLFYIIAENEKGRILPGFKIMFLVETGFILTGILSYCSFIFFSAV